MYSLKLKYDMQRRDKIYSIRALIIRSMYYCLTIEWKDAYALLKEAYTQAEKSECNRFVILCGVLLGYIETLALKNEMSPSELYIKASLWGNKINRYSKNFELREYRAESNQLIFVLSALSSSDRYLVSEEPYNDYTLVLKHILGNSIKLIETEFENDFVKLYSNKKDTRIVNGLNNRRYQNALIEHNLWNLLEKEITTLYESDNPNYYNNLKDYIPKETNEACIYLAKRYDKKNIIVNVRLSSNTSIILLLESSFQEVKSIAEKIYALNNGVPEKYASDYAKIENPDRDNINMDYFLKKGDKIFSSDILNQENENRMIFFPLWNIIFNSKIKKYLTYNRKTEKVKHSRAPKNTLHEILQENCISTITLIPINNLSGIPLGSSYNKTENKYALEYYRVNYKPILVPYRNYKRYKNNKIISLLTNDELAFSRSENKVIGSFFKNCVKVHISSHRKTFQKELEKSSIIHAATHLSDNVINITGHSGSININNKSISDLNLECNLAFINTCKSSVGIKSYDNKNSLPINFIKNGVKTVISTNAKLPDSDAFRVASRFYELLLENSSSDYLTTLHDVMIECIKGKLPYYSQELALHNEEKISTTMRYRQKYKKSIIPSWKYYTIWDGTYEHE